MNNNLVSVVMGSSVEAYRASAEALSKQFNVQSGACPLERTPLMNQAQNFADHGQSLNSLVSQAKGMPGGFTQEQVRTVDQANKVSAYLEFSCGIVPGGMKR